MKTTILCLCATILTGFMLVSCVEPPPPVVIHRYHTVTPKPSDTPENFRAITPPSTYSPR